MMYTGRFLRPALFAALEAVVTTALLPIVALVIGGRMVVDWLFPVEGGGSDRAIRDDAPIRTYRDRRRGSTRADGVGAPRGRPTG